MKTNITEKSYPGVYREIYGKNIKTDITLYNSALISSAKDVNQMLFLVFTNHEQIHSDEDYIIYGIGYPQHYLNFVPGFYFAYTVSLLDNELYYQNSSSGCLCGKVSQIQKYKFNFDYKKIAEQKNTCINLVELIGYSIDENQLEEFAVKCLSKKLLENIFRYRKTYYDNYQNDFLKFRKIVLDTLSITNPNRHNLRSQIQAISSFQDLMNFVHANKNKILDNSDLLYNRNDNIKNKYPINMVGGNISLNLYDGENFNASLPFYFQYRNYKQSAIILSSSFFDDIFTKESRKIQENIRKYNSYFKNENYIPLKVDTTKYGLYFPLLMSFRQSIELAFKLIFVNEDLKKQVFNDKKTLRDYVKQKLDTHNLLDLLFLIKKHLEPDEYKFLLALSSFVYYNEGMDASFSRYLLDINLDFDNLKPIRIYYNDLYNYINEFYSVMDEILSKMNFGFDIQQVFTT